MAETDSLLKRLVSTFMLDFASWLLGTTVQTARPLQSELPGTTVAVDQVFQVTLANGRELLLHLEFQGRRSHEPMQWRMLEYMTRLAHIHHLDLESVVMYIGRGAGVDDTGLYQVNGLDGTPVLAWRYRVIRLWQMQAEALMAAKAGRSSGPAGPYADRPARGDPAGGCQSDAPCRGRCSPWSLTGSVGGAAA